MSSKSEWVTSQIKWYAAYLDALVWLAFYLTTVLFIFMHNIKHMFMHIISCEECNN